MISKKIDIKNIAEEYLKNSCEDFKYVVIEGLFDSDFILKCKGEFLSIEENNFVRYSNPLFEFEKYTLNNKEQMGPNIMDLFNYLHSDEFVNVISRVTNINELMVDGKRWGGGLHMTKKGGYLSVHKDFNVLPTSYKDDTQMLRCVNIIGYVNEDWKDGDGGELEFWDKSGERSMVKIEPKFNRWVIFDTRNNFHGHPYPYKGESPRISIAAYYYIKTNVVEEEWKSTVYLKLPWIEESEEYKNIRADRANSKIRYKNIK
jgi:Rps23 Pro-64 3,4-dihydroxylase Tpa1-like proline 4-hydroxylase